MKNKKLLVLVIFLAVFSLRANAQDLCSKSGYTILTINGIFTDNIRAKENKENLKKRLSLSYNSQPITVDYVYNATHLAGVLDLVDAVRQGLFDSKSDYDLVEMMSSASSKITTQKLLLVGHSQGNFYTNNFYDKVTDKVGGVPAESIGMYSVATPDNHVSGGGKYLTSDTDAVISTIVGRLKNIMTPNTHIELQKGDGNGHDFSNVYLKYRSSQIVSDIKSSFDKLETNNIQKVDGACISPQKISIFHEITGAVLAVTDFTINNSIKVAAITFKAMNRTTISLATTLFKIAKSSLAAVGLADIKEDIPIVVASAPEDIVEVALPIIADEQPEIVAITETETKKEDIMVDIPEVVAIPDIVLPENSHNHNSSNNTEEIIIPEIAIPEIIVPVADTIAPVITLLGESIINIELNGNYEEFGATAFDEKDKEIIVTKSGSVDTLVIGIYTVTYTATDLALNTSTLTRTINVIDSSIILDDDEKNNDDEVDTIPPVITLIGESAIYMTRSVTYVESGATALDDVDGAVLVSITGTINMNDKNIQTIIYTATDEAGNISTVERIVKVSDLIYIPKYTFGTGNGDGHDWQVWTFNGSYVYDWSDTYVDNYLREEFKIEANTGEATSYGFNRGMFKGDPQKGFNASDLTYNTLEGNPQNNNIDMVYNVTVQWDSTGYIVTIFHGVTLYSTTHVDLPNMNNNLWVGWTDSMNQFRNFPSIGSWIDYPQSTRRLGGGSYMMLTPFPIYDASATNTIPEAFPSWSSEKSITSFSIDVLSSKVDGVIDNTNHTISLTVPNGTDVTTLIPTITILDDKATINPLSYHVATNFTNPVTYIVKAEDKTTQTYIATVIISPPVVVPPEIIDEESEITPPTGHEEDGILPTVINYTINGWTGSLQLNPVTRNVNITLTASKKVNWMSIKIEKKTDPTIYKILQSNSTTCVDWQNTCTKVWLGDLSSGGLLQNGIYKIKVHIKDNLGNDHDKYLPNEMEVYGGVSGI